MSKRDTKNHLLNVGTEMFLERGYHHTGLQDILAQAGVPKGSFYHHFKSKEDFGLQIVNRYGSETLAYLDQVLSDRTKPALVRIRGFFEQAFDAWAAQGCRHGCLLGNLGQELADANEGFRRAIHHHLEGWSAHIAECLEEAVAEGQLPARTDPTVLARLLVDGFQGAALRMKLERSRAPLDRFIAHYFTTRKAA